MNAKKSERAGEKINCRNCGKELVLGSGGIFIVMSMGGKVRHRWCRECYSNHSTRCSCCGKRFPHDNTVLTTYCDSAGHADLLCRDCNSRVAVCNRCGRTVYESNFRTCYRCDERMCRGCYDSDAEEHYDSDQDNGHDDGDDSENPYCPCCDRRTAVPYSWPDTKRMRKFYLDTGKILAIGDVKDEFFAGIELETEGHDNGGCMYAASNGIKDKMENSDGRVMWMKTDASLNNDGCELVSAPASVEYHKKYMPWEEICMVMRKHNCQSHRGNHCGLHIHVGKNYFGTGGVLTWNTIKLVTLFAHFKAELWKFSRRTEDSFCRRVGPDFIPMVESVKDKGPEAFESGYRSAPSSTEYNLYNMAYSNGKYSAVNISGERTIEIRLWRGTLEYSTFIATLEMTKLLFDIALNNTIAQVLALSWEDVVEMAKTQTEYTYNYLIKRGLVKDVPNNSKAEESEA